MILHGCLALESFKQPIRGVRVLFKESEASWKALKRENGVCPILSTFYLKLSDQPLFALPVDSSTKLGTDWKKQDGINLLYRNMNQVA